MSEEKEYDLAKSIKKLGVLIPVLRDVHGNVIDGNSRLEKQPDCPSITAENITDPLQLALARLVSNFVRRIKWTQDDIDNLNFIAETTGWSAKEIADNTGLSERTVYRYLSKDFKAPEPKQLASAKLALRSLVECERCYMASRETKLYKGMTLCPSCLEQTKRKPVKIAEKIPKPTVEVKTYKPKEKWTQRKARMKPMVSHMEQRLAERLTKDGIAFESQKEYCIRKTVPDFVIDGKAFYIDFEKLHVKREEKDEDARQRLRRFYEVEPFGLTYKADTKQEEDRLFKQILQTVSRR